MSEVTELSPEAVQIEGHGGVKINVWDYGGDGPTLLLAHCTGTLARIWDPLVPALLPHFRIIAPDTRGHGDSEQPENPDDYRWSNSGNDMLAVISVKDLIDQKEYGGCGLGLFHDFVQAGNLGIEVRSAALYGIYDVQGRADGER